MRPMAPEHDRKRTSPVRITDFESTTRLQGMGFPVVRVETALGSRQALITWRNMPAALDQTAAERHIAGLYDTFSHGV